MQNVQRARAGAGGVQRRAQGRRRPRPLQERRPGLRQRRDPQGAAARRPGCARRPKATTPRVVAQAEGDAQRFRSVLTEYQKAPAVTRDRLYLETMQQVYSNVSKVLVDSRSGSNLLYLPLDKLLQQAGAVARRCRRAVPAPTPPATPAGRAGRRRPLARRRAHARPRRPLSRRGHEHEPHRTHRRRRPAGR
ncbi:MAG: hypothetical protein MZW92_33925 [Comamonadaceae bacterium]|nr:hypothetical protein [Comamonadaceae bacterium]